MSPSLNRALAVICAAMLAPMAGWSQSIGLPDASDLLITGSNPATVQVAPQIRQSKGEVEIVVRLTDPPLAAVVGPNAKRVGSRLTPDQQRAYVLQLAQKQENLAGAIRALGGRDLARVSKAHNAIVVAIDASRVADVARLSGVALIRPVVNYEKSLSTTVPYIGAAAAQAAGIDGTGVKVAVLDSGIDYTHRNLGGPGTLAAYTAAYGASTSDTRNTTRDGLFPTAKVVDGYDFVGEQWPGGPLAPDNDPIDFDGHGTHVADIIAGKSLDGTHKGVAPGASLLAVKVCSSVSTSCSGLALLQGLDFALDPNGDGDISDAVDVINLSLGSNYGQREDDLSEACHIASVFGVVVVAAAGNAADRPYIVSSPATTPAVIAVAETQVPTAVVNPLVINSPASIAGVYGNTATVAWAPITGVSTGDVAFVGRGCPAAGATPADAYLANPAGKVALIDRGSCSISLKVDRAAAAGATAVLIGLVAAGDASSFSFGGGSTFVPTLIITQATANSIKANIAAPVNVTLSSAVTIPVVGSMVASSARGPGFSYNSIKPDIGAPGASVSATVGTGSGEEAFGGTSGATPMIAGSAALLVQAFPTLSPQEIKARLMNRAETNIFTNAATLPGVLAPISRIGGGEVRVNASRLASSAAWDAQDPASVSLSFGTLRATGASTFNRKVVVRNYTAGPILYNITSAFRYAADAGGAVTLSHPASLSVPANSSSSFTFTMSINPPALPAWNLNGGSQGGNGPLLQGMEYDGYVTITGGADTLHLPFQVLPHKAANVQPSGTTVALGGGSSAPLSLANIGGAVAGRVDVFSLTGTSPKLPTAALPRPGDNFAIIDLRSVGVRLVDVGGGTLALQVAINTYGERAHPNYPAEFDVVVDSNNDGVDDYVIFNGENGGFGVTGQNVTSVVNLATNAVVTRFFTDADLNSANIVETALLSDLGLTPSSTVKFYVLTFDNYYTGALTDAIPASGYMTYKLDTPAYFATGAPSSVVVGGSSVLTINKNAPGLTASPSQSGLLLMYRDAKSGREADAITVTP